MKSCLYLLLIFVLASCASKQDIDFSDPDEASLFFDLSDQRFDRFRSAQLGEQQDTGESYVLEQAASEDEDIAEMKKESGRLSTAPREAVISGPRIVSDQKTKIEQEDLAQEVEVESEVEEDPYPEEFLAFDQRSQKVWDLFRPNFFRGEEFVFRISYLGITVGNVLVKTERMTEFAGRDVFHFRAHLKSARYYRMIYELDDRVETFVDAETFRPLKYSLIQRESGQNVDDIQFFDYQERKTYLFYKRDRDGEITEREESAFIPTYIQDTFSTLFFVRGLPLNTGDKYRFPVVTRGRLWIVDLEVQKREQVRVLGNWTNAIVVRAGTRLPEDMSKERESITFWYSDDSRRNLLRFEADIRFGAVRGNLVEKKRGRERLTVK